MSDSPITEIDYLDLARIVRRVRKASMERSSIPAHSGSATSAERKKHRADRRRLNEVIREAESEIVAWAMSVIPVTSDEISREFITEEEEEIAAPQAENEPAPETVVITEEET